MTYTLISGSYYNFYEELSMMNSLSKLIGVHEAAKILGVSSGHIKNMCAQKKLVAKKIGKTWVIDSTDIQKVKST